MFFTRLKGLIGGITVYERQGEIFVTGINTKQLVNDLLKVWKTSRLPTYMFNKQGSNNLSFYSFFAPDVVYVLETLVNDASRITHNRKASRRIIELLYTETWLKSTRRETTPHLDFSQLNRFTFKPLPHQQGFFDQYSTLVPRYNLRGYMLGSAPGTGKTYMGLAIMAMRKKDTVVIVSPKNAVERVWEATVKNVIKGDKVWWRSDLGHPLPTRCDYYIVHYEALTKFLEAIKGKQLGNVGVILDESHNLNEVTAQRTNHFVELCKHFNATDVLWSSGTPIKAIGNEAIPFLRTVDPLFTPEVEARFIKIYGLKAERAVDILANRLGMMKYMVEKTVVVDNKTTYTDVKVKIPNGAKFTLASIGEEMQEFIQERLAFYNKDMDKYIRFYLDCLKKHELSLRSDAAWQGYRTYVQYAQMIHNGYDPELMKEESKYCNGYEKTKIMPSLPQPLRKEFQHVKSIYKYVDLKVRGECLGRVVGRRRTECHVEMVAHANLEQYVDNALSKTVVFTSFVEVVERMGQYFQEKGYVPTLVYGETNKNLNGIIREFDKNQDIDPLIATYKSLSTAVPLTMANTALMFNAPYRQYEYEQATARVDRLDQPHPVFVFNFQLDTGSEPNISTRAKDILDWSKDQVNSILGKSYEGEVGLEELLDELPYVDDQRDLVPQQDKVSVESAPASLMW